MQLEPYQLDGVRWLTTGARTHGLGDDPGLGKSAQAIRAAAELSPKSIGVRCPAKARTNWARQFALWWPAGQPMPPVEIESYDRLVRGESAAGHDVLILDEAHYLKSPTAKRTRAVYGQHCAGKGLASRCGWVWPLSGTIAPNGNPMEIYPHIRGLRPDLISVKGRAMNRHEFLEYFCVYRNTDWGPRVLGVRNGQELRGLLREMFLRRTVQEVAAGLPPIVWSHETVDADGAAEVLAGLESSPEVVELRKHVESTGNYHAMDGVHMASLRRVIGSLKCAALGEVLTELLRSRGGEKVIVFGHHHSVLNSLHEALSDFNPVQLTGETPPGQVQRTIDRFQTDPSCRVFIGQTTCCGEAIELTAANRVEFVEPDWVPARMFQAAKRANRRGNPLPVFARVWGLAGSLDDLIAEACARKLRSEQQLEIAEEVCPTK